MCRYMHKRIRTIQKRGASAMKHLMRKKYLCAFSALCSFSDHPDRASVRSGRLFYSFGTETK